MTHTPEPRSEAGLLPNAQLMVRLGAIQANFREAMRRAAPARLAPVVKANAYSLGMERVAPALAAAGADSFFVARIHEGIALRKLLPQARIFVLDGMLAETAPAHCAYELIPVLNSPDDISVWAERGAIEKRKLAAAVHIDTGMNRLGLDNARLPQWRESLSAIELVLVMSHLACADEPAHAKNKIQLERFHAALGLLPSAPASLAASAGIELGKDYVFDMARPGLGLYGGNPVASRANPYGTAVVLTAPVLSVRRVDSGESVGYGAAFTAQRPSRLATVAVGYADGLMRANGAKGVALLGGRRVPFAGRISMDLAVLDVTDVPEDAGQPGTEVEFLGDTITLEEVAAAAGTNTHEVLTALGPRATRIYTGA
jgi:alanine racemase